MAKHVKTVEGELRVIGKRIVEIDKEKNGPKNGSADQQRGSNPV